MVEPRAKRTGSCATAFTVFRIRYSTPDKNQEKQNLCARLALSGGRRTGTHTARPGPLRSTGVSGLRVRRTFGRKFELGASVHRHDLAHPHGQMRTVAPPSRPPLARGLRTGRTRCYHRASTPTDPRVATMRPLTRQRCRSVCRSRPRATPPNFHPAPPPNPLPPSIEHAFPVLAMTLAPHAGCSFKLPRIPHKHSSNHLTTAAHEDRTDTDPMPYARAMPFTPNRRAGVPSARHGGQPFCLATLTSRAAQSGSGTHPHPHPPEPMGTAATLLKVTRRRCSRSFQIRAHRTPHRGWCTA